MSNLSRVLIQLYRNSTKSLIYFSKFKSNIIKIHFNRKLLKPNLLKIQADIIITYTKAHLIGQPDETFGNVSQHSIKMC